MKGYGKKSSEVHPEAEPENALEIAEPTFSDLPEPLTSAEEPEINDADVSQTKPDEAMVPMR